MPVTPLRPSDPEQVGPHRLLGRLGQGGMGTVYLAVSPDERAVAVKVLRDGFADPDARRRFRHELEALRRVRGPHLVEVLDADIEADTPYLVTRFVPGTRLDDLVTRSGPLSRADLRKVARGLADALTALHVAGVVHRDLTPGNVLVLDGEPHVIDLGLATAADVTALTRSGLVIGTPGYLAPEQVTGSAVTPAADVHAWGATVAMAGTGRPPYGTGRPEAVLYRIVHGEPDLEGLPADLAPLVAAAMDPDPGRRPAAPELLARLGGTTDALPVAVHLPRDVDATTLLSTAGIGARATDPLSPAATRALTEPARELAGISSGPRSTLPAGRHTGLPCQPPYDEPPYDGPPYDGPPYDGAAFYDPRAYTSSEPDTDEIAVVDDAVEDRHRHTWADDGVVPYDHGEPAPREHPARALQVVFMSAAGLGLLGAATLVAPLVGAAAALLLLVVLRAAGRGGDRLRDRRDKRGDRRRDPVVTALGAPWHALLGLLDTALSFPLLALGAALPVGAVYLLDPQPPGLERVELTVAVAVLAGLVTALSRKVHRRSRRLLRSALIVLTPATSSAVAVLLIVAASAVLLLAAAEGAAPVWWPLSAPP